MGRADITRLAAGAVLALSIGGPAAGAPAPVTLPGTVQHDLRAVPDGPAYRLSVGLPPGYDPEGQQRYPVVYVLDGNVTLPFAVSVQRMFVLFKEAPELIVVGIGYPVQFFPETIASRWHDLTPSRNSALDEAQSARFGVELESGGAAEFLRFLRDEAVPFIDANYRTTNDRALWGHSLGGLFGLYALLEEPGLFQRFGISSPSLQFDEEAMVAREAAYAEANRSLAARVYVSLGSEETDISMRAARLVDLLQKREYEGFVLQAHVFQDETHVSVFPAAFSRGLKFLYAAPVFNEETAAPASPEIE